MEYTFVEGDTSSKLRVTCFDKETGLPLDLTLRSVNLRWKVGGTLAAGMPKSMTKLVPQTDGRAEYQFQPGDLVAGTMEFEVEVMEQDGMKVRSLQTFTEAVREAMV